MCLITNFTRPLVSDDDILVCKYLTQRKDGWYTPYMNVPVVFDKPFVAEGEGKCSVKETRTIGTIREISNGYIHAKLRPEPCRLFSKPFRAIIPADTPFYLSIGMDEICAKKMIITHFPYFNEHIDLRTVLKRTLRGANLITDGVVSPGWLLMPDKSFVNPFYHTSDVGKPIGVVCGVVNNKIVVCSLDREIGNYDECLDWCLDYKTEGTGEGDWHFPSKDELSLLETNSMPINVGLILSGAFEKFYSFDNVAEIYWSTNYYDELYCGVCHCPPHKAFAFITFNDDHYYPWNGWAKNY
ncbi:MAG: hypothetical protein J6Y37_09770 [Paludibacteraceae bacterium]|nr:hypothetical protein [Paludibacteraceae bacterium]